MIEFFPGKIKQIRDKRAMLTYKKKRDVVLVSLDGQDEEEEQKEEEQDEEKCKKEADEEEEKHVPGEMYEPIPLLDPSRRSATSK